MNWKCTKRSDKSWRNVAIYVSRENWDKIKYLSASSGKSTSNWIMDKLKEYGNKVPEKTYDGEFAKTLCVDEAEWDIVKNKAKMCNLSVSRYVVAVLLES